MSASFKLATAFVELMTKGSIKGKLSEAQQQAIQLHKDLERIGTIATRAFAVSSAAVAGFVAAASPVAIGTLTGSVQLLAGAIGRAFLPAIVKVSMWLQNAYRWVSALSDAQKTSYANWIMIGIGILGVIVVIAKLFSVAQMAGQALFFLYAHPVVAGFLLVAAAIGYAAYKLMQLKKEAEDAGAVIDRLREGKVTQEEWDKSEAVKNIASMEDKTEQLNAALKEYADATNEQKKKEQLVENMAANQMSYGSNKLFGNAAKGVADLQEADRRKAIAQHLINISQGGKFTASDAQGVGSGILTSQKEPNKFFAIEQMWKEVQAQAGLGTIEAEKTRMEMENNEYFRKIASNTENTANRLPMMK